jgi:hypothetical protein
MTKTQQRIRKLHTNQGGIIASMRAIIDSMMDVLDVVDSVNNDLKNERTKRIHLQVVTVQITKSLAERIEELEEYINQRDDEDGGSWI